MEREIAFKTEVVSIFVVLRELLSIDLILVAKVANPMPQRSLDVTSARGGVAEEPVASITPSQSVKRRVSNVLDQGRLIDKVPIAWLTAEEVCILVHNDMIMPRHAAKAVRGREGDRRDTI